MTEDLCTDGRCKPGKCKPQEEIDAKQSVAQAAGKNQTNRGVKMAAYTREQIANITAFLENAPTQQGRILFLHDRVWSTPQIRQVLRTRDGEPTPPQHINQVIAKFRKS